MQNASQKMHFFNSYLLTKKDEGDSQMKRMKRKCRARLDFHFIKTKDQFVSHKLYIKTVEELVQSNEITDKFMTFNQIG